MMPSVVLRDGVNRRKLVDLSPAEYAFGMYRIATHHKPAVAYRPNSAFVNTPIITSIVEFRRTGEYEDDLTQNGVRTIEVWRMVGVG